MYTIIIDISHAKNKKYTARMYKDNQQYKIIKTI